jgi:hypothetical protein
MTDQGAGWGKATCPVLRGPGYNSGHGGTIGAPPGNQAETEKTNFTLKLGEFPAYSKPLDC